MKISNLLKHLLLLLLSSATILGVNAAYAKNSPEKIAEFLSPTYFIDKKYKSMQGPQSTQQIFLLKDKPAAPELLWITGYESTMVQEDGQTPMPQEFMCHSNLDWDHLRHGQRFGYANNSNPRLFTLSQGQMKIRFPQGFGIPIMSDEPLSLTTQVLNHNLEDPKLYLRHKIKIHFIRNGDLSQPLKSLFPGSAYGLAVLEKGEKGYFGIENPDPQKLGSGCLVAKNASGYEYKDNFGRRFTGHWVVKPGREVNRTLVTKIMNLPYDTSIHYIAVHLHPFAESLTLRDLTTGKILFKSHAKNFKNRTGLETVNYFSSTKGMPVYKDHQYEIESIYNNLTQENQDSMAVMYMYFLDKTFKK